MKDFIYLSLQFFALNALALGSIFMASSFLGKKQWILHFVGFACFVGFIQLATITLRELQSL
jgi:hypothetical protein